MQNQQPLRQRCGVALTVRTSLSSKLRQGPGSLARSIARWMPQLRPTRYAVHQVYSTGTRETPTGTTSAIHLEALSQIYGHLDVAYCDFDYAAASSPQYAHPLSDQDASQLRCYTHVIRIVHAGDSCSIGKWKADFNEKYGIHTLTLLIPPAPLQPCPRRISTFLNPEQLRVACDAIFLALPHDSIAKPRKRESESVGDPANVLVTVPKGDCGEVDAMSVVLTYMSFVERGHVCMVWEDIRRNDYGVEAEWRRAFEGGGARSMCWLQRNLDLWAEEKAKAKEKEAKEEEEREKEKKRKRKEASAVPSTIPWGRPRVPSSY